MPSKWFGSKESDVPEELRDKSPAEIAAELKTLRESAAKVTDLETKLAESNTKFETFKTDFESGLDNRFATLRDSLKPPVKQTPQEMTDFLSDPDKAFAERAAPIVGIAMHTAAYMAKNQAKEKFQRLQRTQPGKNYDGYFFEKFEDEITALARTVPAQQLGMPETWEHIYYNVKGRHSEEIGAQMHDGTLSNLMESSSAGTRGGGFGDDKKDEKLTDQEIRIAEKMGVKPEDYAKRKKEMSGVGINV
jgi:hypothetical protein